MIDLKSHPHVKAIRNEQDEDGQITIIVTDLVMVRDNPRFDEGAFDNLVAPSFGSFHIDYFGRK
jgi:hypothetical protein